MFQVILYQPEIPPNTGNIIRLCANTGCRLTLVRPLGFELEDKKLRRAGLDYHEWANVEVVDGVDTGEGRCFALSTRGRHSVYATSFRPGDRFLFGPETRGLPADLLAQLPADRILRLPMQAHSRSLNLSNSVAVVVYEALRQQGFEGLV